MAGVGGEGGGVVLPPPLQQQQQQQESYGMPSTHTGHARLVDLPELSATGAHAVGERYRATSDEKKSVMDAAYKAAAAGAGGVVGLAKGATGLASHAVRQLSGQVRRGVGRRGETW